MKNSVRRGGVRVFFAACAMLLFSCGGGGGYGGGGGGGSGNLNGQLLDAYVQGVDYTSSGAGTTTLTGTTNVNGNFSYQTGQTTTFSLPVGAGGAIALGSVQPVANASGFTVVFVGGMNNSLEVAQVLQSLNYSGSASQINVSGLTLTSTDVTNLEDFITSGGTSFGSAATYTAMMTQAQTDAQSAMAGLTFVYPGGASTTQAAANLATAAGNLSPPAALNVPGLYFYQEVATSVGASPVSADLAGMDQFVAGMGGNGAGTFAGIDAAGTAGTASSLNTGTYSVSGDVLTDTHVNGSGQTVVTAVTVDYQNPEEILFTWTQTVASTETATATGNAYALSSIAVSTLAGRTITFAGFAGGKCATSGASPVVAFSATGQSYNRYCSNDMTTIIGSGTVAAASGFGGAQPSPLQITDTPAGAAASNTLLMALVSGSIAAGSSGTVALLTTLKQTATGGVNGLFSYTAQ